jgi:hypothetical protein
MATNTRIRLEPDIEDYLRNQAERVIGKSGENVSGAELTTITNRLLYEHKLAQTMVRYEFFPKVFGWLKAILPGVVTSNKVVALAQTEQAALKQAETEEFDFAVDFATQFDEDAA